MRRLTGTLLALALALIVQLVGCASAPPSHFMSDSDQLTPCSSAPHCVSSQAEPDSSRYIAPFEYDASDDGARQALLAALSEADNASVKKADARFIHATFRSTLGFVDDVTCVVQPEKQIIDIKSSSRIGYYDFGVNRRRVERLRARFTALLASA